MLCVSKGVSYFLLAALMVPLAVRVNMGARAFWKVFSLSCNTETETRERHGTQRVSEPPRSPPYDPSSEAGLACVVCRVCSSTDLIQLLDLRHVCSQQAHKRDGY